MCGVGAWGLGGIDTPRSGGFEIIGHPDHTQPAPREIYRQGEERDLARRRLDQAQEAAAGGGLAAARFADQPERLARLDGEGHAIDGPHLGGTAEQAGPMARHGGIGLAESLFEAMKRRQGDAG